MVASSGGRAGAGDRKRRGVRRRPACGLAALACTGLLLAGCSGDGDVTPDAGAPEGARGATVQRPSDPLGAPSPGPPASDPAATPPPEPAPETPPSRPGPDATPEPAGVLAQDLAAPWGVAFLPDGAALVSLRNETTVVEVRPDGRVREVGAVAAAEPQGEGGLLGLAVSPDFAQDRLVYAYLTAEADNRVVRMPYDGQRLGSAEVVLDGIPKASVHNGGRIAFGPDGFLYVGTGDAGVEESAQDRSSLGGKILRVTPDGAPAPGNPFEGSPIWSLGHRNVQGLAWDADGRMWASEFGQNRFDELNRIQAGGNYGWPAVEGQGGGEGFLDPVAVWPTDEASPSGIAVAGQAVYMAALRGARLWQVPIPGGDAGDPRDFFSGEYGRLRTVATAPDGSLWVLTNNTDGRGSPRDGDDRILRMRLR
jgi:aldose sugar dehydrogenase